MSKAFLGRGWKFPVAIDPMNGRVAMSAYEQDIKEAISIILSTAPGERVMRPDFGCGIHDLVFESINQATLGLVESRVRQSMIQFEPRIDVISVDVSAAGAEDGKLDITLQYRVRETNNEFNIVYPFYLSEGTTS